MHNYLLATFLEAAFFINKTSHFDLFLSVVVKVNIYAKKIYFYLRNLAGYLPNSKGSAFHFSFS